MFTIQTGSKFVRVRYYSDPNKIFDVSISSQPNIYRTQKAAEQDLQRMSAWVTGQITWAKQRIADTERAIARAEAAVVKHEARLETLLDLPYRQVVKQVDSVKRSIERERSTIDSHKPSLRSYRADLARYTRMQATGAAVVTLQQTVVALETV